MERREQEDRQGQGQGQGSDWDELYSGDESDYERPDPLVLEVAQGLKPGRALDLGCGAGGLMIALAELGWEVSGIDITDKAIVAARALFARHGVRGELAVADATKWVPPQRYDLVTNTFALPATREAQAQVFATARAALAPGGTLLLKDFDPSMRAQHPAFEHYHLPSVEELVADFGELEIVRAEVVETPIHDHARKHVQGEPRWTAAFLHARRAGR